MGRRWRWGAAAWALALLPGPALAHGPPKAASPQTQHHTHKSDSEQPQSPQLVLDVAVVEDPDFPSIRKKTLNQILDQARATVVDKFGYTGMAFRVVHRGSVARFLDTHYQAESACAQSLEPLRVIPKTRSASSIPQDKILPFLRRWQVHELQAFFPEEVRRSLTTYEAIATALMAEFDRKVEKVASFSLRSGKSLLAANKLDDRSYVRWVCAIRSQDVADIILTNGFILYDLGSEPYPHSIFKKGKVGGASLRSPKRSAIRERAVLASNFSMHTSIPFFREPGVAKLSGTQRNQVIGAFILAHELGHALFKIPDFYDHPKQCLMTTKYETGYVDGFFTLQKYPGVCPKCTQYIDARRHVFAARQALASDAFELAIKELRQAIKKTPKHLDGSYLRTIADLSADIAQVHLEAGRPTKAHAWARSALRIVPDHQRALELKAQTTVPQAPPPASSARP